MNEQSKPVTRHIFGKWIRTPKEQVGLCVSTDLNGVGILFKRTATRSDLWLVRWDELLGSGIFDTEEQAKQFQP